METFKKIKKTNISEQVFELLKSHIAKGKLKAGEKLPSENELCAQLGVSRPPVNAAVNRLRAMGLVEVRPGDGSYVKEFSSSDYFKTYADMVMDMQDIPEILEVRRALEVESFRLAIERATDEDISKLEEICEDILEAKKKKDYKQLAKNDYLFHLHICKCSKNRYFPMMFQMLEGLIYKQVEMFAISEEKRTAIDKKTIDDHTLICKAMREKDFDTYLSIISKHTNYETHMKEA